jgi:ribosomal protein S18 acetylase RimI-like enzyme
MTKKVTTYYLEMTDKQEFKPKAGYKELIEIKKVTGDVFQQWMLFVGVGLPCRWYSRLKWTPDEWIDYFRNNDVRIYLAFNNNNLVGYFELCFTTPVIVEIKFFGLFPSFIGSGMGGALLSHALDIAWNAGAEKVWLHTCTSDHYAALSNYLARGFRLVKTSEEMETVPEKEDYLKLVNEFLGNYFDQHMNH